MAAIIIIIMTAIIAGQNILRKIYNVKTEGEGTYMYLGILSLVASLFFLFSSGFNLTFLPSLLPYGVAVAVFYAGANYFAIRAIAIGPLALSALIGAFSLVVPTTFGIVAYDEGITPWYIVGAMSLVMSILLTNSGKNDKKITLKWAICSALGAIFNGLFSVTQSLEQKAFDGLYKNELMLIGLGLSAVFFFAMAAVKEREVLKKCIKHSWSAAVVGASSGLGNLCKMMLMEIMNLSIIFPLINAGSIIATAAVAVLYYKEKLSKKQAAGLLFGLITIVFIAL